MGIVDGDNMYVQMTSPSQLVHPLKITQLLDGACVFVVPCPGGCYTRVFRTVYHLPCDDDEEEDEDEEDDDDDGGGGDDDDDDDDANFVVVDDDHHSARLG